MMKPGGAFQKNEWVQRNNLKMLLGLCTCLNIYLDAIGHTRLIHLNAFDLTNTETAKTKTW